LIPNNIEDNKATDKAAQTSTTVTSTAVVDSDASPAQTYSVYSQGKTRLEIVLYVPDAFPPAYFITAASSAFSSATVLTVYRQSKDGSVVANINVPSSKSGSPSAAVITYPAVEATALPIIAGEQVLLSKQSLRIDRRHYVWQGEEGENSHGLPTQVLRDEQDDTLALFVWDQKGQPGALGRLHIMKTGSSQDLLDQIVATAVTRVYQEARRQDLTDLKGSLLGVYLGQLGAHIIITANNADL
jgi:hypothetical protein